MISQEELNIDHKMLYHKRRDLVFILNGSFYRTTRYKHRVIKMEKTRTKNKTKQQKKKTNKKKNKQTKTKQNLNIGLYYSRLMKMINNFPVFIMSKLANINFQY